MDAASHGAWNLLCDELGQMGILATIDQIALGRYVHLHQRWLEAEAFIKEHGTVYPLKNKEGGEYAFQAFPQVNIASNLAAQLLRLEQSFGLTPSARAGIGLLNAHAEKAQTDETPRGKKTPRFFRDSA